MTAVVAMTMANDDGDAAVVFAYDGDNGDVLVWVRLLWELSIKSVPPP